MPHPLWEQQGIQAVELDAKGQPVMIKDEHGNLTPKLYWESTGLHSRRLPNGKVIQKRVRCVCARFGKLPGIHG